MLNFWKLRKEARACEAVAREKRSDVTVAAARVIYESEKLATAIEPDRAALRRAGIDTALPTDLDGHMRELFDKVGDLRREAGETPIEHGFGGLL